MNTQKKARSLYWDIVKGWGIIAIVLGHTGYFAGAFVYLFHLALFFFITGYFYNETKYGDTPFLYFGSRLAGAWPRYMFYTLFLSCFTTFCNAQALCGTGTLQPYQNAYGMDEQSFLQLPGTGSGCPLVSAGLAGVLRTLCRMRLVWTRSCPLHPER
ncbi:MAG: acyltransferase family protein [Clostridium fessum]